MREKRCIVEAMFVLFCLLLLEERKKTNMEDARVVSWLKDQQLVGISALVASLQITDYGTFLLSMKKKDLIEFGIDPRER